MFKRRAITRATSAIAALAVLMAMATSPLRASYYAQLFLKVFQVPIAFATGSAHSHSPVTKSPTLRPMVVKAVRLDQKKKSEWDHVRPRTRLFPPPTPATSLRLERPTVLSNLAPVSFPIRC